MSRNLPVKMEEHSISKFSCFLFVHRLHSFESLVLQLISVKKNVNKVLDLLEDINLED